MQVLERKSFAAPARGHVLDPPRLSAAARILGALSVLAVGAVHLQQYDYLYSTIPTIGTLFLLNFAGATAIRSARAAARTARSDGTCPPRPGRNRSRRNVVRLSSGRRADAGLRVPGAGLRPCGDHGFARCRDRDRGCARRVSGDAISPGRACVKPVNSEAVVSRGNE